MFWEDADCFYCLLQASTSDVEVVDDSEFYQQLLVEFLESSNPGGLGK